MVDATLKRHFERAGVGVIGLGEGATFFAQEAVRSDAPVIVVAAPATTRRTPFRVEWPVSANALPALHDHMVQGRIVLPVAVVLERILRAARGVASSPDATIAVRDLHVLSGITIGAEEDEAVHLSMAFDPKGAGYGVTIRDAGHRLRYRATVEWSDLAVISAPAAASSAPWRVAVSAVYDGPLFHGPRFAALAALEDGGARLKSLVDLGWPLEPWAMDPAAIDGGLQLGLLWAHGDMRPLMLPQKITSFTQRGTRAVDEPLRCRIGARPVSDKRVDFDLVFETLSGAVVAVLTGAEFYAVGSAPTATP